MPIEISEERSFNDKSEYCECKQKGLWFGEQRIYQKSKRNFNIFERELKVNNGSDEHINKESNWESDFPALSMKTHKTFTLSSGKLCAKSEVQDTNQKSAGDTVHHKVSE